MLRWLLTLVAVVTAGAVSAAPLWDDKWGDAARGTPATLSYAFVADGVWQYDANYGNTPAPNIGAERYLPGEFRAAARAAFDTWSGAAGLTFIEVTDDGRDFGQPSVADIRLWGAVADPIYPAWAYLPGAHPAAGDIFVNAGLDWTLADGGDGLRLDWILTHEIGHALGLLHEMVDRSSAMVPDYPVGRGRLSASDIASIRALYGPPQRVPEPDAGLWLGLGAIALVWRSARARNVRRHDSTRRNTPERPARMDG